MPLPVVIVGGAAMGSSIAYFLAALEPTRRIIVVERDPTYQIASSALSASSIRQQFSTPVNIELSRFGFQWMKGQDVDAGTAGGVQVTECGYLFLAQGAQVGPLRARTQLARSLGVNVVEFDRQGLRGAFPWMNCDDLDYGAQGQSGEGWFDGYQLMQHFRSLARAAGVQYLRGEATAMEVRQNRVTHVRLADGQHIEASCVVNAAGAWSANVARLVGVDLPVRARRRTAFVVSCPNECDRLPILIDVSGVYVRPQQRHFVCLLSPAAEDDLDDLPLEPDLRSFDEVIWPTLAGRIPAFEALRIERAWAGYYELNIVDHNGLVGQIGPDNFFVATGFSGHGLMHSPGIGRGVAELLTFGGYRTLDLSRLSPNRLLGNAPIVEDAVY